MGNIYKYISVIPVSLTDRQAHINKHSQRDNSCKQGGGEVLKMARHTQERHTHTHNAWDFSNVICAYSHIFTQTLDIYIDTHTSMFTHKESLRKRRTHFTHGDIYTFFPWTLQSTNRLKNTLHKLQLFVVQLAKQSLKWLTISIKGFCGRCWVKLPGINGI